MVYGMQEFKLLMSNPALQAQGPLVLQDFIDQQYHLPKWQGPNAIDSQTVLYTRVTPFLNIFTAPSAENERVATCFPA